MSANANSSQSKPASSATPPATPASDEKPTGANTIDEIKAYLDKQHISYPANAKKDDLLALIK
ncbi:hypothetical protein [Limosilactobacillus vaginalis]|uniref:hypothetical protein n=1 Tax=Limosilactobacillus vaginalis TaxID=1633 RepID=UPI0022E7F03E|nr:hypothetical protein [Limosilactobacillus vaginalis]